MSTIEELKRLLAEAQREDGTLTEGIERRENLAIAAVNSLPALLEAAEAAQRISDGWFGNGFDPALFEELRATLEKLR